MMLNMALEVQLPTLSIGCKVAHSETTETHYAGHVTTTDVTEAIICAWR